MEEQFIDPRQAQFEKALDELEACHEQYFSGRKSIFGNRQDKLIDHIYAMHDGNLHEMHWSEKTDIDHSIRKEAYAIFKSIYQ